MVSARREKQRAGVAPHHLVESLLAAMEAVRPVVQRKLVALAVESEPAAGDPVGVPADHGAEEHPGRAGLVVCMLAAFSVFLKYAKLWERQQKQ